MGRRSLQIDNKIEKSPKRSFFDLAEASEPTEAEPVVVSEDSGKGAGDKKKKEKRFKRGSYIAVSVISVLLVAAIIVSGIDFFIDGKLDGIFKKDEKPTYYRIYSPDWETDIYTVQEYLDLDPDRIVYGNGRVSEDFERGESLSADVIFFFEYFDAIKQGDHKKVNSMFSEEYLNKNGKFSKFPMQKIYNIEIIKYPKTAEFNEKYKDCYDYGIYAVKYNIYRNDGLFCSEVDENHAREEGILIVFETAGVGKIVERIDAKYII